ncbi:MAG: aldo/keto reductase [Nostoc sp.]|uniref:aldo/keto reductase n=1 Tax=Nostoc sp. TaxID=1180 RepID=UPI002FFD1A06
MAGQNNDEAAQKHLPLEVKWRYFLKGIGFIGAGTGAIFADHILNANSEVKTVEVLALSATLTNSANTGEIPFRPLGKTGVKVSAMSTTAYAYALRGATLGQAKSKEEAIRIAHETIDNGITFMDNAWEYNKHRSEEWMAEALQGRRDKVFLMTKVCTHGRDRKVAMQQLEESLRRLKTDHLDLWRIHEVVYYKRSRNDFLYQ